MIPTGQIQIRDPFVVPSPEEKLYYLFGSTDPDPWRPPAIGFDCYRSRDLKHWEGPLAAFRPPPGFWSDRNFWAPEVHRYQGGFYMFASFKAEGVCRGTQILKAERLAGPYAPHSDGPVTPHAWECLDGTLYVDEQGDPWIVFCHEWMQVGDGEICAMRLSPGLDRAIGDPVLLFKASAAPWTQFIKLDPNAQGYVTDGPFLHRTQAGPLLMLWSSIGKDGYAQGIARSPSGRILGPWEQSAEPFFGKDGGHGMIFRTFEGELRLTLHQPNDTPNERPAFFPIREIGGNLELV